MVRIFARAAFVMALVCVTAGSSGAAESAPAEVSATGKLSAHLSVVNDLVPFTFTFHNGTANELHDLSIANLPAEYKLHDLCVNPPQTCQNADQLKAAAYKVAASIPAGGSLVIWGNLTASPPHKPRTLFLVLQWGIQVAATKAETVKKLAGRNSTNEETTTPKPPTTIYSSLAVDLGDSEVQSGRWACCWLVLICSISSPAGALAVPKFGSRCCPPATPIAQNFMCQCPQQPMDCVASWRNPTLK